MIHADTHILAWMHAGDRERLSKAALAAIDAHDVIASPMAVLELQYLHEIGKLRPTASKIMSDLEQDIGLAISDIDFRRVVEKALHEKWTRDPFDRLIVASAKAQGVGLITADEEIRQHFKQAIW